jgi:putative CocE/NonD family hydrolase
MDLTVETDVLIPMRDGIRLSADVFRPAHGRVPVLVHQPYQDRRTKESLGLMVTPISAAERGYAVVLVDARGTFRSEGEWEPFSGQGEDGYDTVEWCAEQPWCDGNVGVYGCSGMGVTTLRTAVAAPPHLRAAMVAYTGGTYHDGWAYTSGVLELAWSQRWALNMGSVALARMDRGEERDALAAGLEAAHDVWAAVDQLPLMEGLIPRSLAPWLYEWLEHRTYDDYWSSVDCAAQAEQIKVPLLQVGGYYDLFVPGQIAVHDALRSHPDPRVRDGSRCILGPWTHSSYLMLGRDTRSGVRNWGPLADSNARAVGPLLLDWFDLWIGHDGQPSLDLAPVRYFVMGRREWRDAPHWPPPASTRELFLRSGGRANSSLGDGTLSNTRAPDGEPHDSYLYNPFDPVPTVGGATLAVEELMTEGVQDQRELELRADVLVYTSEHLSSELTVAGRPLVTLYVSSSAPDTDFVAKLVDVEPSGFCANISEGILRLRHRNGFEVDELANPGETYEVTIRLMDVAHTFLSGHRLRLELASSNYPRFARNLNSAAHPNEARPEDARIAVQHVLHDARHPSRLILPQVAP